MIIFLKFFNINDEHILLITMLTIKNLSTINSLKKKLFRQDNIYNSFRLKENDNNNNNDCCCFCYLHF